MEEINIYTFIHKVIKDCPYNFDGVYEEGETLTPEERNWIESDDGVLAVFSQLPSLPLTDDCPYEFIDQKTIIGRKGYKHNFYMVMRKSDGKVFSYDTTTCPDGYEESVSEHTLCESRTVITTEWNFEELARDRD